MDDRLAMLVAVATAPGLRQLLTAAEPSAKAGVPTGDPELPDGRVTIVEAEDFSRGEARRRWAELHPTRLRCAGSPLRPQAAWGARAPRRSEGAATGGASGAARQAAGDRRTAGDGGWVVDVARTAGGGATRAVGTGRAPRRAREQAAGVGRGRGNVWARRRGPRTGG